ncbi:MAG TPA: PAS domain S-box protein [Gemmataceae bacterium]|jgi:PAS domain S-box-containing protein|nr:PAS domain S-box protein [Gemmataceae bacterium]
MATPLRVLILEDNPSDAELAMHTLRRAGYDPIGNRVETEQEFLDNLHPVPEVILADFMMPEFDSLRALEIMQERKLDVPFIIVSGTIGEERAVQVMQNGATDYIIKDRLARLGPAVKQALARGRLKEEKLKAEHTVARLAAIVETSGDAIIARSLEGKVMSCNRAAEHLFGYSAKEMLGQQSAVLIPQGRRESDTPEDLEDIIERLRGGERIAAFETVRVRKDGQRIEVLLSISPIREQNGVVTGASEIALDITQRKRSERFLNAERTITDILTECKDLAEAGPRVLQIIAECLRWEVAVLWMIDRTANVLRRAHSWHPSWANASFIEALNQKTVLGPGMGVAGRAWSTGEPVWEPGIVIEIDMAETATITSDGLRGGFGLPMRQGPEMVGVIEFYNPELREPDKLLIAALDNIGCQISQFCERRQTEVALHASEEQFRQLADAMPQIVWTAGADGKIDYFNERAYQFAECSREDDPEHTWRSIVHRDDLHRVQDMWANSVRSRNCFEIEIRLIERNTGRHRWFLLRAVPGTDAANAFTRWYGTGTDIDDQKRSLEELRISEERFRSLVMALPVAVYTTDEAGRITLFNEHAVELWGRRPKLGMDCWCGSWKIYRPDGTLLPHDQCQMAVTVREGRGVRGEEIIIERPDGTRAFVLPHPEPLHGAGGELVGAVNMLVDLTQMKQLEEQYRQSQKMEAVGQLAAGVAHDFNNLLTIILGYSEIFLTRLPATDPDREPMGEIRKAGERAAALTRQLLAFGRKQILSPIVLDLNFLLTEIEKMLHRLIGADIELITNLQPGLGCVKVDPGQVEQIIINLVINARDAMPKGGRLTIKTDNSVLTELQVREHREVSTGAYTALAVSDTGSGMDDATKRRIFEPFFTTKEVGKGTGLGLATVFGIIKQSGGFIEVDSAVGYGSTFRVYLPQISEATRIKHVDHVLLKMPRGAETIMLVEDEDGLRELAKMVLEASGYKVLSTRNGNEAIQVCHEYQGVIQLLFTDVVMPKMSGRQLTDLLVPTRPDIKVLYMSGYTDDTIVRYGIQDAGANFLSKPFTPIALAQKVREVLDRGNGLQAIAGGDNRTPTNQTAGAN